MDLFSLRAILTLDSSEYRKEMETVETESKSLGERVGGALSNVGKIAGTGLAAAGGAVIALTKSAKDSYASYEQLVGGVETLFGTGGKSLEEFAKTAKVTAQDIENSGIDWDKYADSKWMSEGGGLSGLFNEMKSNMEDLGTSAEELEEYLHFEYNLDTEDARKAIQAYQSALTDEGVQKKYKSQMRAQDTVLKNSQKAFRTVGLSANAYMEQATSTAAALINSLNGDTEKAAELADQAIVDMSDNANKMGTSMESIQNAYSGFAKGNYTMLDNLKLGFGGTKEEMQRLLDKAGEISGYKYDISSYADIVNAIHVVQSEMGITGTTMKEAEGTISGSLSTVKASWENLMTSLGRGKEETKGAVEDLINSASSYVSNMIPIIGEALENIGEAVKSAAPIIAEKLPGIVGELAPKLLDAAVTLFGTILTALPGMIQQLGTAVIDAVMTVDWIKLGTDVWNSIRTAFSETATWLSERFADAKAFVAGIDWVELGSNIWENIKSAFSAVVSWLGDRFTDAKTFITEEIDWVALGTTIWTNIKTALADITTWISGRFKDAKTFITEEIDWTELGDTIWGNIKSAFSTVVNFFKSLFAGTSDDDANGVKGAILAINWEGVGDAIWAGIQTALATVVDTYTKIFTDVRTAIEEIEWTEVGGAIWNGISDIFSGAVDFFKKLFFGTSEEDPNSVYATIKNIEWGKLGTAILDLITTEFEAVADTLKGFFDAAVTEVGEIEWAQLGKDIWNAISGAMGNIVGGIASWFQEKFNSGVDLVKKIKWSELGKAIWDGIIGAIAFFGGVAGNIAGWLEDKFKDAVTLIKAIDWKDVGKSIWDWITGSFVATIGGAVYAISDWFKAQFSAAVGAIGMIKWGDLGSNIWDWITGGFALIEGVAGSVGAWFKSKFDEAVDAVTNIDWKQLGQDIWDGIKEALGGIKDWFKDLFDFSDFKLKFPHVYVKQWWEVGPISIPWDWGVEWYKKAYEQPWMFTKPTVVGGYGFGDGNGGEMVYGHENLMQDIRDAVGSSGRNNITINVYQQPGEDSEELARRISNIMSNDYDRMGAVYA